MSAAKVPKPASLRADGTSCLLTAAGTKLRCSDVPENAGTADGAPDAAPAVDPSGLDDNELKALHEAVVEEMYKRLGAAK